MKETIPRVFERRDLDSQVDEVRSKVESAAKDKPPEQRYWFHQTDPYTVAADIGGHAGAGTEEQWREYLEVKRRRQFGDEDVAIDLVTSFRR